MSWTLVLTGTLYALLATWRVSLGTGRSRALALVTAFAGMAIWAFCELSQSPALAVLGQLVRSLAWLFYLASSTAAIGDPSERGWLRWEGILASLALCSTAGALFAWIGVAQPTGGTMWIAASLACRLAFAIGGLLYLHSLSGVVENMQRTGIRLIVISIGLLWVYDLNLYTVALLGYEATVTLAAGRPLVALLLLPIFAIAARRREHWTIAFSRKMTFQSLALVAIGLYFVGMSVSAQAISLLDGATGSDLVVAAAFALSAVGAAILFLPDTRAWVKVLVIKHLFSHRYDYRAEWLRFSATIADAGRTALPLEERVVKAIAEVTESPGGLLLLPGDDDSFEISATWQWQDLPSDREPSVRLPAVVVQSLRKGLIAKFSADDAWQGEPSEPGEQPAWIGTAWVAVPLIRLSSMIGVVILSKPRLLRELDWEDFDLLKVIGQQAAVHISDTHNQLELDEARRFDEFNRRFSYIIHDIKNVVSQLSLVASNAQEHGSNPKFQVEMNRSLTSAVQKMSVLLARLSPDRVLQAGAVAAIDVDRLIESVASGRIGQRSLGVGAASQTWAIGDADKLKLAIEHLVQNAIEASPADQPVTLAARRERDRCLITVTDRGTGMSVEFVRKGLFKPFVSTKGGGFGIGAAEARALIAGMGGKLRVSSTEGEGSVFTIELPLAAPSTAG